MSDVFFQRFYNDVKDPAWPDNVENYCDFVKLPEYIKQECFTEHNLDDRLTQLEDADYWFANGFRGQPAYRYENLIFLPVQKCGYAYYTDLFERMDWQKITLTIEDFDSHVVFATIMHPLSRYLKGLTEWVWRAKLVTDYENLAEQQFFINLMSNLLITDEHTVPYTFAYRHLINKIHWIPIDNLTDNEAKKVMMNLFKKYHHTIDLPMDDPRLHVSGPEKLKIYQAIKHIYYNKKHSDLNIYLLYTLFADDLKFYRQLVNTFDTQWSVSNT